MELRRDEQYRAILYHFHHADTIELNNLKSIDGI
jgi:hypothetical protein